MARSRIATGVSVRQEAMISSIFAVGMVRGTLLATTIILHCEAAAPIHGRALKVGVLGGSISAGADLGARFGALRWSAPKAAPKAPPKAPIIYIHTYIFTQKVTEPLGLLPGSRYQASAPKETRDFQRFLLIFVHFLF